jgi:uncharacterized protein (TIGR02466 family)
MKHSIFHESLYRETLLEFQWDNELFYKKGLELKSNVKPISEWRCDTFNTLGSYELSNDVLFKNLLKTISKHVIEFAKSYGVEGLPLKNNSSWINIASPGNYQEYHMHPKNHFSAVYYVKSPNQGGNIVFRSHEADRDMFPLPDIKILQSSNFKTFSVKPNACDLLIFRSNLLHMVEKNLSTEDRVSIAINYSFIENNE